MAVKIARPLQFVGLSTDTKPVDIPAGSTFLELDTKKHFTFDGIATWYEISE